MPPKLTICYDNLLARAVTAISAISAASALPAAAVKNPERGYVYRSLAQAVDQALDIDLGSVQTVTAAAIANVRLFAGGACKLQHRGDGGSPGSAVDVATFGAEDTKSRTALVFPTSSAHRHWRLLFTNPGAVTDYVELGYAFIGPHWEAPVTFRVPADIGRSDPSVSGASLDGQQTFAERSRFRHAKLTFVSVTETQRTSMDDIFEAIGRRTPVFVALDPALAWTHWLARITENLSHPFDIATGRYTMNLGLEEAR